MQTTTGPLGQGVATSVGMAIARAWLAATYNRPGHMLFDHNDFALCSDGDMMEGISAKAASLAGHLKLARLCLIFDSNHISIEGPTAITFTEDVGARFKACGWQVLHVADANDVEALTRSLRTFVETQDRPPLVIVQSHIGYGAPLKQDTKEAHGEPLGADELRLAKQFYGFDPDVQFAVPAGVQAHISAQFGQRGACAREAWNAKLESYRAQPPELVAQLDQMQRRQLPQDWAGALPVFLADAEGLATSEASGKALAAMAKQVPWLLDGAADLIEGQSAEYRDSVLPPAVTARVSVQAAPPLGWERDFGQRGTIIGMRSFGTSAPGKVALAHFGFDVEHVVAAAKAQLARHAPPGFRT